MRITLGQCEITFSGDSKVIKCQAVIFELWCEDGQFLCRSQTHVPPQMVPSHSDLTRFLRTGSAE